MTPSVEPTRSVVSPRTTESCGFVRREYPMFAARVTTHAHHPKIVASMTTPKTARATKLPDQNART